VSKKQLILINIFFILISSFNYLNAETKDDSRIILKSISERYKALGSWSAEIFQTNENRISGKSKPKLGSFVFVLPNKFRFEIKDKPRSIFISDGITAKIQQFDINNKKPTPRNLGKISNLDLSRFLLILKGLDIEDTKKWEQFKKDFTFRGIKKSELITLWLKPKFDTDISTIEFNFKNNELAPKRLMITFHSGTKNIIDIIKWKKIKSQPKNMLNFSQ